MIDLTKLSRLPLATRRRKEALTFGALERDILGIAETGTEYTSKTLPRESYIKMLVALTLEDECLSEQAKAELTRLVSETPFPERLVCNVARNAVLSMLGVSPADWDFIIAPHKINETNLNSPKEREFHKGVFLYLEDIRSPFNLGSIFRTAECFGAEKLYLSSLCVPPTQKRAVRSAMSSTERVPYETLTFQELLKLNLPTFALETGGIPIEKFHFPKEGICVIGNEELGIKPETLASLNAGIVSIGMLGAKTSLNVGVAAGVLMQKWSETLD